MKTIVAVLAMLASGLDGLADEPQRVTPIDVDGRISTNRREASGDPGKSSPPTKFAPADKRPREFKGLPWGASEADASRVLSKENWPLECHTIENQRRCQGLLSVADHAVILHVNFVNGALGQVVFDFHHETWSILRETFIEKYGEPSMHSAELNEFLVWQWEDGFDIKLLRYSSSTSRRGIATMTTAEYAAMKAAANAARKEKAKDAF